MNLKFIQLLLLAAAFILLLSACGGEPAPLPDIDATFEAKIEAIPKPTPSPTPAPLPDIDATLEAKVEAIPKPTTSPTPATNFELRPILILPFTIEHEPTGMMPMGETVEHVREARWGHPGIDFQWPYKAPMVIALSGEVVQIITQDSKRHELTEYSVSVITGEFIVTYEVVELYLANPALEVGTEVAAGEMVGYAIPIRVGDGMHMTHLSFGTYIKNDNLNPNPEGIVMLYRTKYLCPVPYFTDPERQRLSEIWDIASYNERDQFPDLCNGPYKNY